VDGPTYLIKRVVTFRSCFAKELKKIPKYKVAIFWAMTLIGKVPTFREFFLSPLSARKMVCFCRMYGIISLVVIEALDLTETTSHAHFLPYACYSLQTKFDVKSFYAIKLITKNPKDLGVSVYLLQQQYVGNCRKSVNNLELWFCFHY